MAIREKYTIFQELEVVKSFLDDIYKAEDLETIEALFSDLVVYCTENLNDHLYKFGLLLERHKDGIISHALHHISSGKIEGINQRIKTMRRTAYGLPNGERFFLRILDLHGPSAAAA